MPTIEELASLLKKDRRNGVHIDPVFDSKQIRSWTIDKCESGSGQGAWIIDFKEGTILEASIMSPRIIARGGPDYSKNTMNYVKAVRSVR
jgi:hypothetical protein